jgi:hypothetical protein
MDLRTKAAARTRSTKAASPTFRLVLGLPFLAVGVAVGAFWGPGLLVEARATERYVPTVATVEEIEIESHSRTKGGTRHEIEIAYRYTVDGVSHLGTTWKVGGGATSSRRVDLEPLVARHPVGSTLEVFVDPMDPSRAVVERGGADSAWMMIGFGVVFGSIGSALVWSGLSARRAARAADVSGA